MQFEENPSPYVTLVEQTATPSAAASGKRRLFIDANGVLRARGAGNTKTLGGGLILEPDVTMVHADIVAASNGTGFTVLAAPGANKVIVPKWIDVYFDGTAGAYTNIDPGCYGFVQYAGGAVATGYLANISGFSPAKQYFSNMFGTASKSMATLLPYADTIETDEWGPVAFPQQRGDLVNKALEFWILNASAGALTGGNAANRLKFDVVYTLKDWA